MKRIIHNCIFVATMLMWPSYMMAQQKKVTERNIVSVEPVNVESPVGTVPRLPNLVWVTHTDDSGEWRQVKWTHSALSTEKEMADATLYPVGREYEITGYILGDGTTAEGYPINATIRVVDEQYTSPSQRPIAEPIPLNMVKVEGDNRLTSNRDLAIRTILSWDVSQQLYNYRDTYGLPTTGYTRSDGWDSPTTKLKGHGSGHYMSALAFAFASSTEKSVRDTLRCRIRRMVDELRQCQERTFVWSDSLGRYWEARDFAPEDELRKMKGTWAAFDQHKQKYAQYGYGYLNAIPAHHAVLIEMYRPYNNNDWVWAPYYSIHKQLAGLIDIATYVDDREIANKALLIAKDMGLWIWNRLHYRTYVKTDGTQEERRATPGNRYEMWNMYIAGEDGGTGESLSRLSEMVNDRHDKERLLEAASYFDSPAFFDPLSRNIDDIRTRHANQHIPKITSALRSYRGNGNPYYYNLAHNFWHMVQGRYAYSTGGVGNGEMFRQPYTQILSMNTNVATDRQGRLCPNPTLNETCCAYNLAKLTKDLNSYSPDNAAYMDYYERVLYNQIVGSLHPTHYLTTYHYAVGLNASKPWGNRTPQESCCGGTGSENHVKYQEAAYFVNKNTMWVCLYMPTTVTWKEQGIVMQQNCRWPAEKSTIRIVEGKGKFALKLRVPYWATEGFDVKLNGVSIATEYTPSSYVEIPRRKWKEGDVVEVAMPFKVHIHYGPDKMKTAATAPGETNTQFPSAWVGTLMYGPLAMTTTNINHWMDASLWLNTDLSDIKVNAPTTDEGTHGNLYTLTCAEHTFVPDYYADRNSTHYLRIQMVGDMSKYESLQIADKRGFALLIQVAEERKQAQEAWMEQEVKVPEYAPWAPHGYSNLMTVLAQAKALQANESAEANEINTVMASLNAAINTMRPGNLAELEDLEPLLKSLEKARKMPASAVHTQLTESIDYAEMVVKYVSDGSGTQDMIQEAQRRLEKVLMK